MILKNGSRATGTGTTGACFPIIYDQPATQIGLVVVDAPIRFLLPCAWPGIGRLS
jgi:hypothetical protein